MPEVKIKTNQSGSANILVQIGFSLILIGIILAVFFFYPIIYQELKYTVVGGVETRYVVSLEPAPSSSRKIGLTWVMPADKKFSLVVPKIGANSKVVDNVDPFNNMEYQNALTLGIAHAKGTVYPGQIGNTFLFAHSSVPFYEATKYNSEFYLLNKLEVGDEFYITHDYKLYKYIVKQTKVVAPEDVSYIEDQSEGKTATLMTCWPAGTDYKRLLVIGELTEK